ncbi:6-aminopenicillanic acid acyl-transferase family protein [Bordetella holmesii 70147]|nr:6-aminopenicillanic acid acyl-transferase family protein [Bordetella holmesii 70147]
MPLEDVLLWNCRGDLLRKTSDGCTSLAWRDPDGNCWMAHNEDGDPYLRGRCRIVDVHLDDAPGYVSFYYPGSLPGHTFASNRNGLTQTINNVRLRQRQMGVPRMLVARAVLDCTSLQEALDLLQTLPRAGVFITPWARPQRAGCSASRPRRRSAPYTKSSKAMCMPTT